MGKNVTVTKSEMAECIKFNSVDSLMLTIAKPHAKANHLNLTVKDMEPIISKIINMANSAAFGKHKHFEFLRGIIVCESIKKEPHFHIILKRPQHLNFEKFNKKITKVSTRLCDENFKFNLSVSYLKSINKNFLTTPCYKDFAETSIAHEGLGEYLTKEYAYYYLLENKKVNFDTSRINVYVDFKH